MIENNGRIKWALPCWDRVDTIDRTSILSILFGAI